MKNTVAILLTVLSLSFLTAYGQQDSVNLSLNEAKDLTRAYLLEKVYISRLKAADSVISSQNKEILANKGVIDANKQKQNAYKNFDVAVEEFKKQKETEVKLQKKSKRWWQLGFLSLLGYQVYKEIKEVAQ